MTSEADFRRLALSFAGVEEGSHFDVSDFRVRNRIFATLRASDGRAVLKLAPDQQALLAETTPGAFEPVPGSWGLKGWTRVVLDKVDDAILGHAMTLARRSVAPKPARGKRGEAD